jgi:hypothetical protein
VGAAVVKPKKILYLAMPNMPDNLELVRYANWYGLHLRRHQFRHDGYGLDVHELTLRQ